MRGAPPAEAGTPVLPRIIPADAGSTVLDLMNLIRTKDHPRRCGEHDILRHKNSRRSGSSPQMRGAPGMLLSTMWLMGIIPADAGSTPIPPDSDGWLRDHPRRCGEHKLGFHSNKVCWGSSPQMRGARPVLHSGDDRPGIIPADAGSTVPHSPYQSLSQDHPRRCGEHESQRVALRDGWGSSPQMRGAHDACVRNNLRYRIIPADAGSTGPHSC